MPVQYAAIRGMNDILPSSSRVWQHVESNIRALMQAYACEEIRLPVLEKTELFIRSVGEVTDIVEKEMYTFLDRNNESLTLRPEGTAGCVRAGVEHGLFYHQLQKLWYMGPMFRYERPQKGRYRQFHHFGLECYGFQGPAIDAEIIQLCFQLWQRLNVEKNLTLKLNTLGTGATRAKHREALIAFYEKNKDKLDEDANRRLYTNPLRILDSKNAVVSDLNQEAPKLTAFLDDESKRYFDGLCALLTALDIHYVIDEKLVRGLDYYQHTVFEWVTTETVSQNTVCGGGRYDLLVEQVGGHATPAIGFGVGLERLVELCQTNLLLSLPFSVYLITLGDGPLLAGMQLAKQLRESIPSMSVFHHLTDAKLGAQLKRAAQVNADVALILGSQELENNHIQLKNLKTGESNLIPLTDVLGNLQKMVRENANVE